MVVIIPAVHADREVISSLQTCFQRKTQNFSEQIEDPEATRSTVKVQTSAISQSEPVGDLKVKEGGSKCPEVPTILC